jgi:hypothetical protein
VTLKSLIEGILYCFIAISGIYIEHRNG